MPDYADDTIDDLARCVTEAILEHGTKIQPTSGRARELTGVLLELRNPLARLSRTETRGRAFSCLGELCWYLSASDDIAFIEHYLPRYREYVEVEGDRVLGAYGPRICGPSGSSRLDGIIKHLENKPHTRNAVIPIIEPSDLHELRGVPCTALLQFLVRDGLVHLLVTMRSNDLFLGFTHDVFCFTMLQELVARALSLPVGWYRHFVGSLHLYDTDRDQVDAFLAEGWQPTNLPMPPMPNGDPRPALARFLACEDRIRSGAAISEGDESTNLDPYWRDLLCLLKIHAAAKHEDLAAIRDLQATLECDTYQAFIESRCSRLANE